MSRIFSTNSGAVDSLNVSDRCGRSEKALQMRCTVVTDRPLALAIERRLQCVAPGGVLSSVALTTAAILSSPILRGVPGLGSSLSPCKRRLAKRLRHVATVTRVTPSRAAMAVLLSPAAASSTIAARCASAREVLRRRDRIPSSAGSVSDHASRLAVGGKRGYAVSIGGRGGDGLPTMPIDSDQRTA